MSGSGPGSQITQQVVGPCKHQRLANSGKRLSPTKLGYMPTDVSRPVSGQSNNMSNMSTNTSSNRPGTHQPNEAERLPAQPASQTMLSSADSYSAIPGITKTELPDVVDLFSGCGGLSMGFQNAGFKVLGAYDNWDCAVDTFNLNHQGAGQPEARILDLSDVDATVDELSKYRQSGKQFPAIIGGPPCQDFSSAGKRVEGDRADLTEKFALIIEEFEPEFFLMENVSIAAKAGAYQRAIQHMRSLKYAIEPVVLDASLMGVPQSRKRLIAFGSRDRSLVARVLETWQDNLAAKPMTIREYVREVGQKELEFDHYYRHPRSYLRRGIFSVDEPSPTIRGVNRPIPKTYEKHPADPVNPKTTSNLRALTTIERAQIQTFPADFKFSCARTNAEQLIGNAVPVRMGEYLAKGISQGILR